MKKIKLIVIVFFVFFSCNTNEKEININNENTETISVEKAESNIKSKKLLAKNIEYIPLETTEESLFGNIDDLQIIDNLFFILDKRNSKGVFVFDKTGKFLYKIQRLGLGSGEYSKITDFKHNKITNELEIYDDGQQKIIIYNIKGEFIREINNKVNFYRFFPLDKNQRYYYTIFFKNKLKLNQDKEYRLFKIDNKSSNIIYNALSFNDDLTYQKILGLPQNFYSVYGDNAVLFYEAYNNHIYELKNDSISVKYKIDFVDSTIPDGFVESDIKSKIEYVNKNKFSFVHEILFENAEELTFNYTNGNLLAQFTYNKKSKKAHQYRSCYVENDNIRFRPSIYINKDASYSIIEPFEILRMEKESLSSPVKKIFGKLKETSNPVIVKMKR